MMRPDIQSIPRTDPERWMVTTGMPDTLTKKGEAT